jgi:hypothetical protein
MYKKEKSLKSVYEQRAYISSVRWLEFSEKFLAVRRAILPTSSLYSMQHIATLATSTEIHRALFWGILLPSLPQW